MTGGPSTIPGRATSPYNTTALIQGDFKLVLGGASSNFWQGPDFPNASYDAWMTSMGDDWSSQTSTWCGYIDGPGACLFNIREDPHETVNLASSLPQKVEELKSRVRTLRESLFNPDRCL